MKKSDLTFIVGSVFIALTSLFYCSTIWFAIKLPRYYPLEHVWKWTNERGVPSQGWYGMQGFAFLAAGLVSVAVYLALKALRGPEDGLKPGLVRGVAVVTLLIVLVSMTYLLYHEFRKWGILA